MQLTFEGTLKLVQKGRDFVDKESGDVTPAKFTHYFQTENADGEPQVVEIKSKKDYSALIDREVVCTVELFPQRDSSGFWASLVDCHDVRAQKTIKA